MYGYYYCRFTISHSAWLADRLKQPLIVCRQSHKFYMVTTVIHLTRYQFKVLSSTILKHLQFGTIFNSIQQHSPKINFWTLCFFFAWTKTIQYYSNVLKRMTTKTFSKNQFSGSKMFKKFYTLKTYNIIIVIASHFVCVLYIIVI